MIINPLLYRQNLIYLLIGITILITGQVLGIYYYYHFPLWPIITDAVIAWFGIGMGTYLIANTLSYYNPSSHRIILVWFGALILSFIWWQGSSSFSQWIIENTQYDSFIESTGFYRISVSTCIFSAVTIISLIWYRLGEEQDAQRRKEEMLKLAKNAELFKLRQQLQPHFLFNSLNSINALIMSQPQKARTMVHQLSDFLRGTLKREDQKVILLSEELEYLKLYLDIEQVRFGHRLKVDIKYHKNLNKWKLPPLILQPILENAIKFGVYGTTGEVLIKMEFKEVENHLLVKVTNPFDTDMQNNSGTGFGLKSVQRRLILLYSRVDLLEHFQENDIFTIELKIPKNT